MSTFSKKSSLFFCALIALSFHQAAPVFADDSTNPAAIPAAGPNATPAAPISAANAGFAPDVVSLEKKFFDHAFSEDTMDVRVERLEKMVFGEAKTGSLADRITALIATVPDPAPDQPATPVAAAQPASNQNVMPANTDESPLKDSSDYPRITQLEHEILGKTFVNEPVTQRLDQLERKAFGAPSTSDDLSARSDALERYANNHFPSSTQTAYNSGEDEVPAAAYGNNPVSSADFLHGHAAGDLAPSASLSQQVSWLETRVYGQNYPTDALVARVKRLQASIFPGDNNSKHETMPEQIHSMIGAVELAPSTPMASGVEQNQNQTLPSYAQPANASSYYTPPTNYEQPTYNGTPAPFSSSPPAYNNTASAYPGNQYAPNNQYPTQYPANNQYPANSQYQPQQQQSTQPVQSTHKSSLLHGLAHALGTVGSMALRSGMMMGPGMY